MLVASDGCCFGWLNLRESLRLWGVVQVWELSGWGLPPSLTAEFRAGSWLSSVQLPLV